jgi:hypothetical protein
MQFVALYDGPDLARADVIAVSADPELCADDTARVVRQEAHEANQRIAELSRELVAAGAAPAGEWR